MTTSERMTDHKMRRMRHIIAAQQNAIVSLLFIILCAMVAIAILAGAMVKANAAEEEPTPAPVVEADEKVVYPPEAKAVEMPEIAVQETVIETGTVMAIKATAYCPCEKCCGEWADGITYTGTTAKEGRTIAVDPKVIPLGSRVVINGNEYIAEDIGGAIKGNRIDVFFATHTAALEFGVQNIEATVFE